MSKLIKTSGSHRCPSSRHAGRSSGSASPSERDFAVAWFAVMALHFYRIGLRLVFPLTFSCELVTILFNASIALFSVLSEW